MTSVWQATQWEARVPLDPGEREKAVEELLMWCSYAGRVEPGLLRALRRALTDADAVCEMLVSRHKAVASPSAEALTLDPHAIAKYRRRFEQEVRKRPEAARRAWQILRSWRQPIGDEFMFEELISLPRDLRELLGVDAQDIALAEAFWSKMAAGARDGSLGNRAVEWLERVGIRREPDAHGILDHAAARQAIEWAIERRLGAVARSDKLPIVVAGDRLLAGETSGSPIGTIPYANGDIWVDASLAEVGPSPLPPPLTTFRDPLADGTLGPAMVSIPPGSFLMGSPEDEEGRFEDEGPRHEVQIEEPFALAKYPVTFEEYDAFCDTTGREKPDDRGWGRGRHPVINVNWEDARAYCNWLSEQTGEAYRLPSEAEWEYACRANTTTRYWWGKDWNPKAANGHDSGQEGTTEVGSYPANRWGLHDTQGNVHEWCEDKRVDDYTTPRTQTAFLSSPGEARRVLRGCSWSANAEFFRAACRFRAAPGERGDDMGFRPARGQATRAQASQVNAERSGLRAEIGRAHV
jgi:formylglycine-generating enzyme required for sulfatase activity